MLIDARAWHAGNHYADWALLRDMAEFDQANNWLDHANPVRDYANAEVGG